MINGEVDQQEYQYNYGGQIDTAKHGNEVEKEYRIETHNNSQYINWIFGGRLIGTTVIFSSRTHAYLHSFFSSFQ